MMYYPGKCCKYVMLTLRNEYAANYPYYSLKEITSLLLLANDLLHTSDSIKQTQNICFNVLNKECHI